MIASLLSSLLLSAFLGMSDPPPDGGAAPLDPVVSAWLQDTLIDPDSARIKVLLASRPMSFKKTLIAKVDGEVTCLDINAKNRFGGYAGPDRTLIVVKGGKVIYTASERYPDGFTAFDVVANVCGASGRPRQMYFAPLPAELQIRVK